MIPFADDDGMKSLADEIRHSAMGHVNQWTGCLEHIQSTFTSSREGAPGRAMGGDHDGLSGDIRSLVLDANAARPQVSDDCFVVDKLTENGQRLVLGFLNGKGNGITNAEAHA